MGDFICSLSLEIEDTNKEPERKAQSMREQFPELESCAPELETFFSARSLPLIKVLSVKTFCNANDSGNTVNRIVEVPDEILPEVQTAILNIINCLKPEHRNVMEIQKIYGQIEAGAAEKYIREYFERYPAKVPVKRLSQSPRVLWLESKDMNIGHSGSCEVRERTGLILNEQ